MTHKNGHNLRSPKMHWSVHVTNLSDDFVSFLVLKKRNTQAPFATTSTQCGSVHLKNSFVLRYNMFPRSTAFMSPWSGQFQFVNLYEWEGRGRLTCETMYVKRYVTKRDILERFVTLRYDALRNRCNLEVFPYHMQKGLLLPLSTNATRTKRWSYICLCESKVSYWIPAKFHKDASLLFHSCAVSSSVQLARSSVKC